MTRSRTTAKQAGTAMEKLVAEFLAHRLNDDRIERRTKNGRFDRGDITGVKTIAGARVVIEAKSHRADNLPSWVDECQIEAANDDAYIGVVAHKRWGTQDPASQFVTMNLETFARLLEGGVSSAPVIIDDPHTAIADALP